MQNRTKKTQISQQVKNKVYLRDNQKCIICGSIYGLPEAHYISRAKGGLGIEQNIVTLCRNCHSIFDLNKINASKADADKIKNDIKEYLQNYYGDSWTEEKLIYKKWG